MRVPQVTLRVARALWQLALPALVTALALPLLLPAVAAGGIPGVASALGRRNAVVVAAVVFVALSAVAQYWEPWVFGAPEAPPPKTGTRAWLQLTAGVVVAALAAWAMRRTLVESYVVVGPSMLPTFEPDDRVLGRPRLGSSLPARGDVIAFRGDKLPRNPRGGGWPDTLVKRVIGLPGDRVFLRDGSPVINDWPVPTCEAGEYLYMSSEPGGRSVHGRVRVEFLDDSAYLVVRTPTQPFEEPYEVRPGEVFVLGDNRGNSTDSRALGGGHGGGVPLAAIDANVRWFLAGTHRSGRVDLGRFLSPLGRLEKQVRLEGVDVDDLRNGVAKCLASRPANTHPPAPTTATAALGSFLDFGKSILRIGDSGGGSAATTSTPPGSFLDNPDDLHARHRAALAWSVP